MLVSRLETPASIGTKCSTWDEWLKRGTDVPKQHVVLFNLGRFGFESESNGGVEDHTAKCMYSCIVCRLAFVYIEFFLFLLGMHR